MLGVRIGLGRVRIRVRLGLGRVKIGRGHDEVYLGCGILRMR